MADGGNPDEKVIGVPSDRTDPTCASIGAMGDLPPVERDLIEAFFRVYKDLPHGRKQVALDGYGDAAEARALIIESLRRYEATARGP